MSVFQVAGLALLLAVRSFWVRVSQDKSRVSFHAQTMFYALNSAVLCEPRFLQLDPPDSSP